MFSGEMNHWETPLTNLAARRPQGSSQTEEETFVDQGMDKASSFPRGSKLPWTTSKALSGFQAWPCCCSDVWPWAFPSSVFFSVQ